MCQYQRRAHLPWEVFSRKQICYLICSYVRNILHERRNSGELYFKQSGCEFNGSDNTCYSHTGPVAKGTGDPESECRIFSTLAEDQGRCVLDEANTVVPAGNRFSYTYSYLGHYRGQIPWEYTAKECLVKCLTEKKLKNVFGCEYHKYLDGETLHTTCDAITTIFKGGDGTTTTGSQKLCWTLLKQQTVLLIG